MVPISYGLTPKKLIAPEKLPHFREQIQQTNRRLCVSSKKKKKEAERVLPNLVRSIERTRPTGPAPTIRTGNIESRTLKSLETEQKPLLWKYSSECEKNDVFVRREMAVELLRNPRTDIGEEERVTSSEIDHGKLNWFGSVEAATNEAK